MDRRACQVKVWSAGCLQDFQKLHCCKCFTVYMLLYECHQFIEGIRRTPGGEKIMAMCLDKEPNQAENMIHDFSQWRRVIFCKLNSLQPVNIVDVMTGKYLKSYLISLLIHSSLPLGWFGSRFHPSMLLSFIWSPHIISHQFDISPATGITAVPPLLPIQSYSITSHYWSQEAGCHISIHAKMSPMSPVGRLSLQNKTCCCWHRRCSVQTHLSVLLIFLTLHIYFVPFHCTDGQSWCFQCARSQEWLPQKDSLKDPFSNFVLTWVWEFLIIWIKCLYCLTDTVIRIHTLPFVA